MAHLASFLFFSEFIPGDGPYGKFLFVFVKEFLVAGAHRPQTYFPKQKEARLGVGFLLVFKKLPAPQPAKQPPQTGTCHPRAIGQPSGSHRAAIGQPSGSHPAAIRQPSGSHPAAGVRVAFCGMSQLLCSFLLICDECLSSRAHFC